METLQQNFYEFYARTTTDTIRDFSKTIDWNDRMIGIKGSRGVGKTTMVLQHIVDNYPANHKVLYTSLDNFYFSDHRLYNLADRFQKEGGQLLAIDEVHKYPDWSIDLKNIYDNFPHLNIIFTGSSLLHLQKARADLSRRAVMYSMPGLSFREFLTFELKEKLPVFGFEEIIKNHIDIAIALKQQFKPFEHLNNYLSYGYYPYYLENKNSFHLKLAEVVHTILEVDIPQFEKVQVKNIKYLKKLLRIISYSVPFKPNFNGLSQKTEISLNTLKLYIKYLVDAQLLSLLYFDETTGLNSLSKPEKLYLNNTNLMFNLSDNSPNTGNLRETFFFNQVSKTNKVVASKKVDFKIDDKYSIEIGGKHKKKSQIKNIPDAYIVKDNIEIGVGNVIPLWLFGFLY